MLKIYRFFYILQNILLIILLVLAILMFGVRYRMKNIINSMSFLDKKIENMYDDKKILEVELAYLTSTERLLALIEKKPEILNNKKVANIKQVKTEEEFENFSLSKAMNNPYNNKKYAKTLTNFIIENEI